MQRGERLRAVNSTVEIGAYGCYVLSMGNLEGVADGTFRLKMVDGTDHVHTAVSGE